MRDILDDFEPADKKLAKEFLSDLVPVMQNRKLTIIIPMLVRTLGILLNEIQEEPARTQTIDKTCERLRRYMTFLISN